MKTATPPVISSSSANQPQAASSTVTTAQNTVPTAKITPHRSARRRRRNSRARGSAAALSLRSAKSERSAKVPNPRCNNARQSPCCVAFTAMGLRLLAQRLLGYHPAGGLGGRGSDRRSAAGVGRPARRQRLPAHRRADLLEPGMTGHLHTGLLHLEHPALYRTLRELGRADRIGVPAFDLVAYLVEARSVARGGDLGHRPQRRADLLLHLRLLELAEQLGALRDLLLQDHRVLLYRLLGLRGRAQRLIVQGFEVLDALLGGHQLGREGLGGVVVLGGLGRVAGRGGLVGQRQRLTNVALELFDVRKLPVEAHLQLPLIADHLCRLLSQRLMRALRFLDGLLDLHLGVGVLVNLRVEQRHEVLPPLDERIGHELAPLRLLWGPWMGFALVAQFNGSAPIPPPLAPDPRRGAQAIASEATGGMTTLVLASILV